MQQHRHDRHRPRGAIVRCSVAQVHDVTQQLRLDRRVAVGLVLDDDPDRVLRAGPFRKEHQVRDREPQRLAAQSVGSGSETRPVDDRGYGTRQHAAQPCAGVTGVLEHEMEQVVVRSDHAEARLQWQRRVHFAWNCCVDSALQWRNRSPDAEPAVRPAEKEVAPAPATAAATVPAIRRATAPTASPGPDRTCSTARGSARGCLRTAAARRARARGR